MARIQNDKERDEMKEKLKEQIQKLFPNEEIIIENDGWFCYAFTVGEDIVRIAKTPVAFENYKKEQKLFNYLRDKVSFEIPDIEIINNSNFPYSIHKKILGENWDYNTYNKLTNEAKDLFAQDIAKFFTEIHSVNVDEISKITDLKQDNYLSENFINDMLKSEFSQDEIKKISLWIKEKEGNRKDDTFIHKDFHPGNCLVDENHRLKGVFDLGDSCIGDKHLDFHSLYKEEYLPLLNNVISQYNKMSDEKIDINKVKDLKEVGCIYILEYLHKHPKEKAEKINSWNKQINRLKGFINDKN